MKELRCREAGFECDGVVRAEEEEEVMAQAAEHLRSVHGIVDVDDDTADRLRSLVKEV